MLDAVFDIIYRFEREISAPLIFLLLFVGLAFACSRLIPLLAATSIRIFVSKQASEIYARVSEPYKNWLAAVFALVFIEAWLLLTDTTSRSSTASVLELGISLSLTITVTIYLVKIFRNFFDTYLLEAAFRSGRRLNSELLIVGKYVVYTGINVISIIIFAQAHQINVVGLIASLGLVGLAVAFSAQEFLKQLLGGVILYIDRPFAVDDYIGLSDGTFGRVESIGIRSTRIRTSGKGTVMVMPNNILTQSGIENFTSAKKVMTLLSLNFYQLLPDEERALIQQVIRESTNDIFGIDTKSTVVNFREFEARTSDSIKTQAQIVFFILGAGQDSMDLRRQLLGLAGRNIRERLAGFGIEFGLEEPAIYVDSPITM